MHTTTKYFHGTEEVPYTGIMAVSTFRQRFPGARVSPTIVFLD